MSMLQSSLLKAQAETQMLLQYSLLLTQRMPQTFLCRYVDGYVETLQVLRMRDDKSRGELFWI